MLDLLSFEKLSDFCDSLPYVLKFKRLVLVVLFKSANFVESFLHLPIAFFDLLLLILYELHHVSALTDELLVSEPLLP